MPGCPPRGEMLKRMPMADRHRGVKTIPGEEVDLAGRDIEVEVTKLPGLLR